jgi:hyperosmotically inducible periplasmic protein
MHSTLRAGLVVLASFVVTACGLLQSHETETSAYVGDTAITARLKTALIKDPHIQASEIEVQTNQGRVTLNGVVDNDEMARRVLDIARATPGVRTIDDKLIVSGASSPKPTDAS